MFESHIGLAQHYSLNVGSCMAVESVMCKVRECLEVVVVECCAENLTVRFCHLGLAVDFHSFRDFVQAATNGTFAA